MNIRQYTGGMKRSNIVAICQAMALGYRKPKSPKRDRAKITFRGTTAEWIRLQNVAQ